MPLTVVNAEGAGDAPTDSIPAACVEAESEVTVDVTAGEERPC